MGEKRVGGEELERESEEGPLLFETKRGKGRGAYKLFSCTIFSGICMIWVYRVREMVMVLMREEGRRLWTGFGIIGINIIMLFAEMWFGLYWIITQSPRWTLLYHTPFKHILSQRYGEDKLQSVDIFVCTADPLLEPPTMVISTVLSAMSYNYPSNKLSVYLSDDGASDLTFFALLKASLFAKHWIPFCKTFNIEPRSPEAYFSHHHTTTTLDLHNAQQWSSIKKLYEDMKREIESAMEKGTVPDEVRNQHKGFSEWNAQTTKQVPSVHCADNYWWKGFKCCR